MRHKVYEGHLILYMKDFAIIGCYLSPNISLDDYQKETDNIMGNINSEETLILGDINAKSAQWGSPTTDKKGHYWMNWISAHDMVVHNRGTKPTFVRGQSKSFIDVTLSTEKIASKIGNWKVLDEETLTEHQYIYFEVEGSSARTKKHASKIEVDWEAFGNTIGMMGEPAGKTSYKQFTKVIQLAYRNSKIERRTKPKVPYWWNDSIARKREECHKLRRSYTRNAITDTERGENAGNAREAYKASRRELRRLIRKTKRSYWRDLCLELDNDVWGDAYKIVAKKLDHLRPYEPSQTTKKQIVDELFVRTVEEWDGEAVTATVNPFNEGELKKAASSLRSGRAPGLDGIPPEAVKMVASVSPRWTLDVLNHLLKSQEFPEEWKTAKVILIPKSGKPPELASSYRPLCMLNATSKLLEVLIRNRLQAELDERGGLHPHQYGFTKGKSTVDAVETVMKTAEEYDRSWCVLITIDVKNAFNSACHSQIIKKLKDRKISRYLTNFIASYLRDRAILLGDNQVVKIGAGVPQGSVLGPTLWNVLYDDVLDLELTDGATSVGFADDLALIVGARDERELVANTNTCLSKIGTWMKNHKLTLAPDKTEAVILRGRRKRDSIRFIMEGVGIVPSKTVKYLGITIDDRGTLKKHVEAAVRRAESKVSSLIRIMPNIGGPRSGKRAVVSSAMHSMLLYGAPVWHDVLNMKKYKVMMEKVQRSVLLRVASAFRTVSGVALQVVTGTVPIDLLARERSYTYDRRRESMRENQLQARKISCELWQSRWDREVEKAQWTRRLIPNLEVWLNCRHRNVDYYLTQALTAHGVFRAYAKRFCKDDTDACIYCLETDTAEHTLFNCSKWNNHRKKARDNLGSILTPNTLVPMMVESVENWRCIHQMIRDIMKAKEHDELARQSGTRVQQE